MSILEEIYLSIGELDVTTSKKNTLSSLLSGECMSEAIFVNFFHV